MPSAIQINELEQGEKNEKKTSKFAEKRKDINPTNYCNVYQCLDAD